ncbi:MAG: fructosamine kinase family protein [Deltaproteobacteria bacterium]|nr:fructosamine kinase family protein [Deltaproteobacteria bacterium]
MTRDALLAAVEAALGSAVATWNPVAGGDINAAHEARLADGRMVFVKSNPGAPAGMFAAEARGLDWLAEARALRVPAVLAEGPDFLVLEHIAPGRRGPAFDETLGRGLAALHRSGAPGFGLDHDNFIGRLPQANAPLGSWADFYRQRRLLPQLRMAVDGGRASPAMRRGFDRLLPRLEDIVGPPEPPARLHGDLWGGNAMADERGQPCLIDPAVYGGHREVDLGMMRLFGGFSARVFAAYAEAFPLPPDSEGRVPLHQLYFLMVHVNLFGGSYVASVEHALARLGA